MNLRRKLQAKNRKYDSIVDADDDEELAKYDKISVPKNKEKIKLSESTSLWLHEVSNKRCNGCCFLFNPIHCKPRHHLIFRYVTCQTYREPGSGKWMMCDTQKRHDDVKL